MREMDGSGRTGASFHVAAGAITLLCFAAAAVGQSKDVGGGFADHGVVTPISHARGTVATVDDADRNVVLVLMMDHRGGYALLMLDAQTGEAHQFAMPFEPRATVDSPYASILSSGNKFYTHFTDHFVEFDPSARKFTFAQKTTPQMAMGMTEDDAGVIWAVTYPQSGVVSFDPKTRALRDYGQVYPQNWVQYQRFVAADDKGWIYWGLGMTASQIIIFDRHSGKATPVLNEEQRGKGSAYVYRDEDGKVYGQPLRGEDQPWYELYDGQARLLDGQPPMKPKPIITGDQGLFHRTFPNGSVVKECNLTDRRLVVEDAKRGQTREMVFDYTSEGAHAMAAAVAPDGTICGGTAFPMRFFSYDPRADRLINRPAYLQWNTVARQGDRFFVGGYPGGFLLEWEPAREWVNTEKGKPDTNPLYLTEANPAIHRPHRLLALADGKTIVLAGTPAYGHTGGGMLFWDGETRSQILLEHTQLVPEQSTMSLVELPNGKLLGGTTTAAGTGGEKKAQQAVMYIMDAASKQIEWQDEPLPGVQQYVDLHRAGDDLIYGVADRNVFFVFDSAAREVIHQRDLTQDFGPTAYQQGPRIFIPAPDGVYLLFSRGIVRIEPRTHELSWVAKSPIPIVGGGDYLDGRIYFLSDSHLCSYELPRRQ